MVNRSLITQGVGPRNPAQVRAVADLFAVLAEPTRLHILQALRAGPMNVNQLAAELGLKQANASKQLGILRQAGLLDRQKQGNVARYAIRTPLVFKLCDLVCGELQREALARSGAWATPPFPMSRSRR